MKKNLFMKYAVLILLLFILSCKTAKQSSINSWVGYDEKNDLAINAKNESSRLRYKLIQSKILNKNEIWKNVFPQIRNFSESDYLLLEPLIFNQDIPSIQSSIKEGKLSYEKLTQWYLYRIVKFENDKNKALNNIISINPNAVKEARKKDRNKSDKNPPVYGMPVLLKDNIDFEGLATTAGAHALQFNYAKNAFIVDRLKKNGAIILGKVNLSEWANYLCLECPNGYSAIGGQTLNPYGIKMIDTGGSSAGSGSSMAANYAAAAVGTETSGSILSPSSQHSLVGLKPTTGLLSRSGIVPISSTFDTPGPMTRNVMDNAIMLDAMSGTDKNDTASKNNPTNKKYWEDVKTGSLVGVKFGVIKAFLKDSLYKINVEKIKSAGGIMTEIEFEQNNNDGFGTLLNTDMKVDLANYLKMEAGDKIPYRSVADIITFNKIDTLKSIPYGQGRFDGIMKENKTDAEIEKLKVAVRKSGVGYFEKPMVQFQLDFILSIANRSAGYAAAANYPCITVPMGYRASGEPVGITFISRPFMEDRLLKVAYAFEQVTKSRKVPVGY